MAHVWICSSCLQKRQYQDVFTIAGPTGTKPCADCGTEIPWGKGHATFPREKENWINIAEVKGLVCE